MSQASNSAWCWDRKIGMSAGAPLRITGIYRPVIGRHKSGALALSDRDPPWCPGELVCGRHLNLLLVSYAGVGYYSVHDRSRRDRRGHTHGNAEWARVRVPG